MTSNSIPSYIEKYFWGDNLDELDLEKKNTYIIQTLLEKGDQKAIKWLFSVLGESVIKEALPAVRLSKKSEHFWNLYLS